MMLRIPDTAFKTGDLFMRYAEENMVTTRRSGITHDESINNETKFEISDVQK